MRAKLTITALTVALACSSPAQQPAPKKASKPPTTSSQRAVLDDARSMIDFGAEWSEIASLTDEEQKRLRALSLVERWEGRRYEWDAVVMANLCEERLRRCSVNVIERKQIARPELLGGFFPTLSFTENGFAMLRQQCKGKASCVVRFRGVLSSLRADPDMPLGMDFTETTALSGREPKPEESWWREGPSFQLPEGYKPSPLSLVNPNEPPLPPLKVKIVEKAF